MTCTCATAHGQQVTDIYQIISPQNAVLAWGRNSCPVHKLWAEILPEEPQPPEETAPEQIAPKPDPEPEAPSA